MQDRDQDVLLPGEASQAGRSRGSNQESDLGGRGHHSQLPGLVVLEVECQKEGEEADDAPQQAHGRGRQEDPRAA